MMDNECTTTLFNKNYLNVISSNLQILTKDLSRNSCSTKVKSVSENVQLFWVLVWNFFEVGSSETQIVDVQIILETSLF